MNDNNVINNNFSNDTIMNNNINNNPDLNINKSVDMVNSFDYEEPVDNKEIEEEVNNYDPDIIRVNNKDVVVTKENNEDE